MTLKIKENENGVKTKLLVRCYQIYTSLNIFKYLKLALQYAVTTD